MKGPIVNITQAKEEMARLVAFSKQAALLVQQANNVNTAIAESVEALQNYFGVLDSVASVLGVGSAPQPKTTVKGRSRSTVKLHASGLRSTKESDAPPTVQERVLVIMKTLGKPVLPKQIAVEYLKRNWPLPKKGNIYNLISGTVIYLCQRKGVLIKGETGYTLKPHENLDELVNAPMLPASAEERAKRNEWQKARYARKREAEKAEATAAVPFLPLNGEDKAAAQ